MTLPISHETPRGRHLQNILEAATANDLSGWPMLNEKDYVLIGGVVVLFSYIDLNLRRILEAFDERDLLDHCGRGLRADAPRVESNRARAELARVGLSKLGAAPIPDAARG